MATRKPGAKLMDWLVALGGVVLLYFFFLLSCALDDACSALHMMPL